MLRATGHARMVSARRKKGTITWAQDGRVPPSAKARGPQAHPGNLPDSEVTSKVESKQANQEFLVSK